MKNVFDDRFFAMGLAMLWIVVFHVSFWLDNRLLRFVKDLGYGGVDVFLLCSGFGCFCSLERNGDVNSFLTARVKRIMPVWLVYMLFWIPARLLLGDLPVTAIIGNILCIQGFTMLGKSVNWYISALWFFYLLSPYLHGVCKRNTPNRNILTMCFFGVCSIPFWNSNALIIGVSRLPVFYLGMILAKRKDEILDVKKQAAIIVAAILGVLMIALFMEFAEELLWSYALYWYPFIFIAFGLCLASYWGGRLLVRLKMTGVYQCVCGIGRLSFEYYLVHILILDVMQEGISAGILLNSNWTKLIAILIVFPASYGFNMLTVRIVSTLKKRLVPEKSCDQK